MEKRKQLGRLQTINYCFREARLRDHLRHEAIKIIQAFSICQSSRLFVLCRPANKPNQAPVTDPDRNATNPDFESNLCDMVGKNREEKP
jgi:hypothetical protein